MIDYNKYDLMKECLAETFDVYKETLDVGDYVPETYLKKIYKWIYKNMKKKQRKIDGDDRKYQRQLKKLIKSGKIPDTNSEESVLEDYEPEDEKPTQSTSTEAENNQDNNTVAVEKLEEIQQNQTPGQWQGLNEAWESDL